MKKKVNKTEPEKNIDFLCEDHSKLRLNDFQETWDPCVLEVGDHVKLEFTGTDEEGHNCSEHMWVYLLYYNEEIGQWQGRLDNIPIWLQEYQNGDKVYICLNDVSQFIKGPYHE